MVTSGVSSVNNNDMLNNYSGVNEPNTVSTENWQKALQAAVGGEQQENTEDTVSISASSKYKRRVPSKGINMLEALIDKAVKQNVITADEATELKALLEKKRTEAPGTAAAQQMKQIFEILQSYLADEGVDDDATAANKTKSKSITEIRNMEKDRLEKLKAAVTKAQADGKLTADQLTKINGFIADQEKFMTIMSKIDASGIQPDLAVTTTTAS